MFLINAIVSISKNLIGGFLQSKSNSEIARQTTKGVLHTSLYGLLLFLILFACWQVPMFFKIFGIQIVPDWELYLGWRDEVKDLIYQIFIGSAAGYGISKRLIAQHRERKKQEQEQDRRFQKHKKRHKRTARKHKGLRLLRHYKTGYTYGQLEFNGKLQDIFMLERPRYFDNIENVRGKTCILEGVYPIDKIEKTASGKNFKGTGAIWLKGVFGRDGILVHIGNFVNESDGCLMPNKKIEDGRGYDSVEAMKELTALIKRHKIKNFVITKGN